MYKKSLHNFNEIIILFLKYMQIDIKSQFQYKINAFMLSFAVFFREIGNVFIVYLMLEKFGNLNGWKLNEMMFLYSLLFLSYSFLIIFFTGIRDFDNMVYSGEFDKCFLRPVGILYQIIASRSDYFAAIGHGTVGIVLFLSTAKKVGIVWDLKTIAFYSIAIASGVIIQASILMFFATFSFFTIRVTEIRDLMFYNVRKFAGYPISIFPSFIQKIMIFIIPFAFVNYFPAQFFLRKHDMQMFWSGYIYLSPLVAFTIFLIARSLWKFGLKHYSSTGTAF